MPTLETTDTLNSETLTAEQLTAEEVAALIVGAPAETPEAFVPTDAAGVDWVLAKHGRLVLATALAAGQ